MSAETLALAVVRTRGIAPLILDPRGYDAGLEGARLDGNIVAAMLPGARVAELIERPAPWRLRLAVTTARFAVGEAFEAAARRTDISVDEGEALINAALDHLCEVVSGARNFLSPTKESDLERFQTLFSSRHESQGPASSEPSLANVTSTFSKPEVTEAFSSNPHPPALPA